MESIFSVSDSLRCERTLVSDVIITASSERTEWPWAIRQPKSHGWRLHAGNAV
jgi:hypothetical protein